MLFIICFMFSENVGLTWTLHFISWSCSVAAWFGESQTEAGTVTWSPLRTAVNGPLIPGTASCDLTLLSPGTLSALSSSLSLYPLIYRAQQA